MDGPVGIVLMIAFAVAVFCCAFCMSAGITYGLWNWVGVSAFDAPPITFWQAIGITLLFMLLGGGVKASTK
jgi:uncharacterized RDD family membrane protein YckC